MTVWEVVFNDSESYYTLVHVGSKAEADSIVEHLRAIAAFEGWYGDLAHTFYAIERTVATSPKPWSLADAWSMVTDEPAMEEFAHEVRLSVEAALDTPEETTRDVACAQQLKDADRG